MFLLGSKGRILCTSLLLGAVLGGCGTKDPALSGNTAASGNAAAAPAGTAAGETAEGAPGAAADGKSDTGSLTAEGSGYEGTEGSGKYNYGEALQKSLLFYELQRSGDLPEAVRCNWRGDSAVNDGADVGLDLSGGWFDAGDHVKFNLPMAYSGTMLAWSALEDKQAYIDSGQLEFMQGDLRWVNDYLMKCHASEGVYYYQVGDGGADHSWWGPAEVLPMERPAYKVTKEEPGSAVAAEAAASLAAAYLVFSDSDAAYAADCLSHAKALYAMADEWRSDAGYTRAAGFYDSWSGFNDELAWAGAWLYKATGEQSYLDKAKKDYAAKEWDFNWSLCWDDVHIGAAVLLAQLDGDKKYTEDVEKHLDFWTTGTSDGQRITYTPKGLAWLDGWGPLRYATTTAFVAAVYSRWDKCPEGKKDSYWDFALSQADYALGSSGRSYVCGFGENPPVHPHHRTAQGSYCNNMNEPAEHRHILYGALVGGPDASDNYTDEVSNYQTNEVACDYNAGFTGLLAAMYSVYHGQSIKDFGAVETPEAEFYTEAGVNVDGDDFIEIKAYVYNVSAWPARVAEDLELRYYLDLSELYTAGQTAGNIEISNNYMSGGRVDGLKAWDEAKHLYYLSVVFDDGSLYPGGQEHYKKEIQVRLRNPGGVWDDSNDPSFACLAGSGQTRAADGICLYESGELIWGSEPEGGADAGKTVTEAPGAAGGNGAEGQGSPGPAAGTQSADNGSLSVSVRYDGMGSSATALAGNMEIKNQGSESLSLKELNILYYFTKEGTAALSFDCYHAALQGSGGSYQGLKGVNGAFSAASGQDADTLCTMSFGDALSLEAGDTLVVNFSIHLSDWSAMNTSNDWSVKDAEHIVISRNGTAIFGEKP
ncbi:MAG: glycoside hydrolase family 9 protein [Lachnospiraceae bacterium]|nr:glycoside hydrolase family 9 protein [Lachnospiraceae bacterium]